MYPLRFPKIFQASLPSAVFYKKNKNKTVYLTFDDGPSPEITSFVLDELKKFNAKATFFCIGDKMERYPEILKEVIGQGHVIGNHTYHHVDAWKISREEYLQEIIKTEAVIKLYTQTKKIFRPPYGHITPLRLHLIKKQGFKVILWTSIAGDFKRDINTEKVIKKLSSQTKTGDILVFHDSEKAGDNLKKILPELLINLNEKGFKLETL